MLSAWAAVLGVALFVCGCSSVTTKPPIMLELPSMDRHFIVMGGPVLP